MDSNTKLSVKLATHLTIDLSVLPDRSIVNDTTVGVGVSVYEK